MAASLNVVTCATRAKWCSGSDAVVLGDSVIFHSARNGAPGAVAVPACAGIRCRHVVKGYRMLLLDDRMEWPHWGEIGVLVLFASVIFVTGGMFFRHLKRGFADVL